jgi:hypothetical protein
MAACIASLINVGAGSKGLDRPLFPWIPGDQNDNAFNNWVLERNFQLLKSGLAWTDIQKLFSTNSFWPLTNTLALSDNWIALTPVYAFFQAANVIGSPRVTSTLRSASLYSSFYLRTLNSIWPCDTGPGPWASTGWPWPTAGAAPCNPGSIRLRPPWPTKVAEARQPVNVVLAYTHHTQPALT